MECRMIKCITRQTLGHNGERDPSSGLVSVVGARHDSKETSQRISSWERNFANQTEKMHFQFKPVGKKKVNCEWTNAVNYEKCTFSARRPETSQSPMNGKITQFAQLKNSQRLNYMQIPIFRKHSALTMKPANPAQT